MESKNMVNGKGSPETILTEAEVIALIEEGTPTKLYEGKKVLVLTPDTTRTCPLPMMVRAVRKIIGTRCATLDFMVALGTHPPMSESKILSFYGISEHERQTDFSDTRFFNHRWDRPDTFKRIGYLEKEVVNEISGGRLREKVAIDINRNIFDYDLVVVLGPVFPHEVVGFSGGAKYLFPGISGGDFLHFFHWLGAVITCRDIIGIKNTPVRDVIHRALKKVDVPVHLLAMVVTGENRLCGLYTGDVQQAWEQAADLSEKIHIVYKEKSFRTVIGRAPEMYDEIWVAGKVMYKLEQVVAEGGKLIIYGEHINHVSRTWGKEIEKIGYHIVDYFLAREEQFSDIPRGVLAHSTHVRGTGSYDNGIETPRIDVILATGIAEDKCRQINLGYMNPSKIRIEDYLDKEDQGILFVDHAGETLYKLKN
jgi:nickel-dependent lactate racemase